MKVHTINGTCYVKCIDVNALEQKLELSKQVWAYESCFCTFETGYAIQSLHSTKELAEQAMKYRVDSRGYDVDGDRIVQVEIDEKLTQRKKRGG